VNKYLEKIAAELKSPANPTDLGIDLSKGDEKELYKWLTAVTLFSKPIQRNVAAMAAKHMGEQGFTSPEAVEGAGWNNLRKALIAGHYGRFDESTATRMLNQAKHLKEKYGTLTNLINSKTPEEIKAEIQSFNGIGPLGSQIFMDGLIPHLDVYKNKYLQKAAQDIGIIKTEHGEKIPFERHKYVEKDWTHLANPVGSNKFDGAHFFLVVQPDGTFKYYSRRPSVKGHNPERSAQLPQLNANPLPQYAGDVFSTELIHTGHNKDNKESHPNVSGILNSKVEKAIATQQEKGPVRAVLLDVKDHNLPTFREKLEYLKKFEDAYGNKDVLFMPKFVEGHDAINKYLEEVTKKKSEGIIVTDMDLPEEQNPRYKVKNFQTYNLKISGPLQQEIDIYGKPKNSMGAVPVIDASGRFVGMVGTGWDRATRISAWQSPEEWQGKMIQVRAYPPSKQGGHIRFPIYNGEPDGDIDLVE
jgi:hypothetical protein